MAAATLTYQNGVVSNADQDANSNSSATKKSRENERRRRRRKQKKKNNKASKEPTEDGDDATENTDPQQVFILLPVLYGLFSFAIDNGTITGNDRNRLDVSNCSHVAVVKLGL